MCTRRSSRMSVIRGSALPRRSDLLSTARPMRSSSCETWPLARVGDVHALAGVARACELRSAPVTPALQPRWWSGQRHTACGCPQPSIWPEPCAPRPPATCKWRVTCSMRHAQRLRSCRVFGSTRAASRARDPSSGPRHADRAARRMLDGRSGDSSARVGNDAVSGVRWPRKHDPRGGATRLAIVCATVILRPG